MKSILLSLFLFSLNGYANMIAETEFHAGWASTQGELQTWVESAPVYHASLFIGKSVNKGGISRAGYSIDFSYSQHEIRGDYQGYYKRLTGDLFFLPLRTGIFVFTPGICWVMSDVFSPRKGLDELSFRPGFLVDASLQFPITEQFKVNLKSRYDWVMEDKETPRSGGAPIDITGSMWSNLLGFSYQF